MVVWGGCFLSFSSSFPPICMADHERDLFNIPGEEEVEQVPLAGAVEQTMQIHWLL